MKSRRIYPTQKRLQEIFTYCPSGQLVRRSTGRRGGCLGTTGYWQTIIDGKLYYEHVAIYIFHHEHRPNIIDHIDRNKLNNQIRNLRKATLALNSFNRKSQKSLLGVRGVQLDQTTNRRKPYRAYLNYENKNYYLGRYITLQEAKEARKNAEQKIVWAAL